MKSLGKFLFLAMLCLMTSSVFAMEASEVMEKSKAWFKTGKAWNVEFKLQVYYKDSPDIASESGKLLVAEGDKFRLEMAGIKFYSDGESMWQWNVEQKQVLIKAVEDLSSTFHPSELLFKYLNCEAKSLGEGEFGGQKHWVLKLNPAKYAGQFSEMEVWLSKKDFSPTRLYTVDPSGNASWYNIIKLNVMKKISNDDFKYKTMKDVDEIDMR